MLVSQHLGRVVCSFFFQIFFLPFQLKQKREDGDVGEGGLGEGGLVAC